MFPRGRGFWPIVSASGFALLLASAGCRQPYSLVVKPSPAQLEVVSAPTSAVIESLELGKQPLGSKSDHRVFLRNKGDLPALIQSVALEPAELARSFAIKLKCESVPGKRADTCPLELSFSPVLLGDVRASVRVVYDDGQGEMHEETVPLSATVNNLALLRFEQELVDLKTDTIGYSVTATVKVLYNGTHIPGGAGQIKPAMGVVLADPANTQFTVDPAGTTCGREIEEDCVVRIKFAATALGAQTGSLNLSYFNGSESLKTSTSLKGVGVAAVQLATLSAPGAAFGNVVFNPAAPKILSVPVAFAGSVPAEGVKITGPAAAAYTLDSDPTKSTCLASTTINGNCTLSLKFNPTARASYPDKLVLTYSSNGQARPSLEIPVSGQGVNPAAVTVSGAPADFGSVAAFRPMSRQLTLTNGGEAAVSLLSALSLSNATDFSGSFEPGCATLAPGATCRINLGFKPLSAGALTTTVGFSYFDGRATQTVSLSALGTGTAPLLFVAPGTVVDFGDVMIGRDPASIPTKELALNHYGIEKLSTASQLTASPAALSSPFDFPGGTFPGGGTCAPVIDPAVKSSCTLRVKLTATTGMAADTQITQAIRVTYAGDEAMGSGNIDLNARMTPRVPPVLAFQSPPSSFGTLAANDSSTLSFTVRNLSPYFAAAYSGVALSGDSAFSVVSNGCTGGVARNGSCVIQLRFKPTEERAYSGALQLNYNDGLAAQSVTASFTGTGSGDVRIAVSGSATVDFGNVYLGDPVAAKTVTLRYYGLRSWTPSFTAPAPFSIDATSCGGSGDCSLSISYAPGAPGASNFAVPVSYSPAVNPGAASFTLTLKGNAISRSASLAVSPLAFPKTLLGSHFDQVLSVRNNGSASASMLSFGLSSSHFSLVADDGSVSAPCAGSTTLGNGQSCNLKIRFAPSAVGSLSAPLAISYLDGGRPGGSTSAVLGGIGTVPIQIAAGAFQTCIVTELQQALCWGANGYGQLGNGTTSVLNVPPASASRIGLGSQSVVRRIAVGAHHACAIVDVPGRAGLVSCWGDNANGRLGLGSTAAQLSQPQLDGNGKLVGVNLGTDSDGNPHEAVAIAAGFEHTCAVLNDGKLKCWGGNSSGQLGIGSVAKVGASAGEMGNALQAVDLKGVKAVSVSAGAGHSCAALADGSSKCWGDNYYGQLGQGSGVSSIGAGSGEMGRLASIALGTGAQVQAIHASSGAFTCAVLAGGSVKCFGKAVFGENTAQPFFGLLGACFARASYNSSAVACASNPSLPASSALGYYPTDLGESLPSVRIGPVEAAASQLATGDTFSCALLSDKTLRCWGANDRGQLGNGRTTHVGANAAEMGAALPSTLAPAAEVQPIAVAAGAEHACAVLSNNTVKCWGGATENATGLKHLGIAGDALSPVTAYAGN